MATQTYQAIQVERRESVSSIVLNKPPLNILDLGMIEEINDALRAIEQEEAVRVVVFRGAGEKAFCAGVSIQDHTPDRIGKMIPVFHNVFRQIARTDKLTVAAVHGHCLGGGLELVSICDLVVATEKAQMGQPEIRLGQLPPVAAVLLPYLIGYRKAAELLLTGKNIGAREAQTLGLVNRVVPDGELTRGLEELIGELTAQSGAALRITKRLLRRVAGLDFERLLGESEEFFLEYVAKSADAKEGIFAFLEKRAPHWTHR
jgi:cyclohexa-1,5-dienecarbonyl-CoA hydratase